MIFLFVLSTSASAHDFYDADCCSEHDCAPVTKIEKDENGDLMTTKHGTILVNPKDQSYSRRISPDHNFHVCQINFQSEFDTEPFKKLICVYYPVQS
jgi:hypothetical protein